MQREQPFVRAGLESETRKCREDVSFRRGGGVSSSGGAIAQPMVWVGRDLGRFSRITFGAGVVRSIRGELSSPVIDVSWAAVFGTP